MDDLIKGLVRVGLDLIDGADQNPDHPPNNRAEDERSRSTWAEVVSEEPQNHDASISKSDYSAGRPSHSRMGQQESYPKNEWSSAKSRPANHEVEGSNDDGWQTVGRKHTKEHLKVPKNQWNNFKRPLGEQEYSNEVECGADIKPLEDELSDLSKAITKLWDLDLNRLVPGKDYEIDCGKGKKVYQKQDMAQGSLFSWLSEEIFRKPTYSRFCSLLDNYNPHEGCKEVVTSEERQEQAAFIEEISRTAPIKYLYKYLLAKRIAPESYEGFKKMMTSLWFDLYGRGGTSSSSSAFEHVFVGEIKRGDQEVSGFHNWIQFYLEEEKGRVNYQGYIFPRRRGETPDSETQLLTIQFEWNGVLKAVSSSLIGVSPEFELAAYTLCFFLGGEDNYVEIGPYSVNIKCYRLGDKIGSVFPVAD